MPLSYFLYNGGRAGAIGVQNIGYLTVTNSNFINNYCNKVGGATTLHSDGELFNCTFINLSHNSILSFLGSRPIIHFSLIFFYSF